MQHEAQARASGRDNRLLEVALPSWRRIAHLQPDIRHPYSKIDWQILKRCWRSANAQRPLQSMRRLVHDMLKTGDASEWVSVTRLQTRTSKVVSRGGAPPPQYTITSGGVIEGIDCCILEATPESVET